MFEKASQKRRLFIAKNLIMMLVLAVLIVLAVSAWLSSNSKATANGISIKARYEGIDIAKCIKYYNDDYTEVVSDGPGVFGSTVRFEGEYQLTKDCTGDGKDLIIPEFNIANDYKKVKQTGKDVNTELNPVNAVSSEQVRINKLKNPDKEIEEFQYYQFEFYVRSKKKDISLTADSSLLSRTEIDGRTLGTTSYQKNGIQVDKLSSYGSFNVDGLVGAIRVALIGEPCTSITQKWNGTTLKTEKGADAPKSVRLNPEKQLLWLPRPDIFLKVSEGSSINDWELMTGLSASNEEGTPGYISHHNTYYKHEQGSTGVKLINDESTVVSEGTENGHAILGKTVSISDYSYNDDVVPVTEELRVKPTDASNTSQFYVTKYTLNIWIEGSDAEARRAMDGGEFDLNLVFG